MKVAECMNRDVRIAGPDDTLRKAAKLMCDVDAGVLPVGENDRLGGMVTDRESPFAASPTARDRRRRCATS